MKTETYIVDELTGEILECRSEFHIETTEELEWSLERLMDMDSELAKYEVQQKAILENLATLKSRVEGRKSAFLRRFQEEMQNTAKQNLPDGKRSFTCAYGTVKFMKIGEKLKVADPALALEYAADNEWFNCIKQTAEFQISKLSDVQKSKLMTLPTLPDGFSIEPERENTIITTGI